jgi:predicted RNase H-like HicB family nuclease
MANHDEILAAALRICRERGAWTFSADEIVRALPHLNAGTIRTHVTSRCCLNAPSNHPHRWGYFKRVARGVYEVVPKYRPRREPSHSVARETPATYGAPALTGISRHVVHALVSRADGWYSADCMEIAVVTQGRTLDETVTNLKEAVALHLEGETLASLGLAAPLTLSVTYEEPLGRGTAPAKT